MRNYGVQPMYITNQISGNQIPWDKAGVSASILCVTHCLITPFLVTTLPVAVSAEGATHSVFAIIILLLGMLAFFPGYQKHKKKYIPALGFTGISLIIAAAFLPDIESAKLIETNLVVTGGITLIYAHLRNAYWCRFCNQCNNDENCCGLAERQESS